MEIKAINAIAATICAMLSSSAGAESYIATKLGSLGGNQTYFQAMNDSGQVTGAGDNWLQQTRAFVSGANGIGMTDLGILPGRANSSAGVGINNSGQVVGYSAVNLFRDGTWPHAFITGPNGVGMIDLGTLGGFHSRAYDINNAGQVVGFSSTRENDNEHAFITGPNGVGMTDIAPATNFSIATAINDSSRVVGYFGVPGFREAHAFITGPNGVGITDLGTLGGDGSSAWDINESGRVVGQASTADGYREAFVTGINGLGMISLGTLGGRFSSALSINNQSQVVGHALTTTGDQHAFVTGIGGVGMLDLNSLVSIAAGHHLQDALSINNVGQILAMGSDGYSYLLTPVPEPNGLLLLLGGLVAVGVVTRQRKLRVQH